MNATAIIGANYGDEGKGLMTDYFAKKYENSIVIRFNGGAQAGHTVQLKDGTRHVFHHFGSGTLRNRPTYLTNMFIVNPLVWQKEFKELKALGYDPKLIISPNATITLPYDMLLNQELHERKISTNPNLDNRPSNTCGIGIFETVFRTNHSGYIAKNLYVSDAHIPSKIKEILEAYRKDYIFKRIEKLNIWPSQRFWKLLHNEEIEKSFIDACLELSMNSYTSLTNSKLIKSFDHLIFEGAQGLLLDQNNRKDFPFLTPSNTGTLNIRNILLLNDIQLDNIEIVFVTRSYLTRHGNGPLEGEPILHRNLSDKTNIPNEFQGTMRYATLDTKKLEDRIQNDISGNFNAASCELSIAMTCLDQLDHNYKHMCKYKSYGPTAEDVV